MKYACNLIRDLLPLYHDGAASSESAQAVEEHLETCSACREYYDKICGSDVLEQTAYDKELTKKAAASYQRVYRKLVRKIGKIIGITVLSVLLVLLLLYVAVVGYLYISAESLREIHRDMESYGYLDDGKNVLEVFADGGKPEDGIWRESITDDMEVEDYLLVYYHPWDANYLGYLKVTYDKEAYAAEVARLLDYPSTEYLGNYGASGFADYEVLAMHAGDSGFVYALTDGKDTIIYVGMIFPGYSMDIEYEEYLPEEYLPEGLDIGEDNLTKQKKTERWAQ